MRYAGLNNAPVGTCHQPLASWHDTRDMRLAGVSLGLATMFFGLTSPRKQTTGPPILPWLLFGGLASCIPRVLAASVNRTIDDTFGDSATGLNPTFGPSGWQADDFCIFVPFPMKCGDWAPNDSFTFNHTYHFTYSASTYLSLQFTGTAIYVYTLVINSTEHGLGNEAAFGGAGFAAQVDGGQTEVGQIDPTEVTILPAYDVLLYSKIGLENTTHNLTIRPVESELLFFDYAVYTFEEPDSVPSSSSSSGPTLVSASTSFSPSSPTATSSSFPAIAAVKKKKLAGPIAGGVIGGLILLGALGLLLYCVGRRRRKTVNPGFAGNVYAKRSAPWPANPIPRNFTPEAGFIYEGYAPETWSDAAATPRLSPVDRSVPVSFRDSALEEKNSLHLVRQEEAGMQVALLELQIRDLTEQARPSLPSESMNTSAPRRTPDLHTNAQLVAQIRVLKEQIDIIQNEMQISGPPEYTAAHPDSST
ncbi:hypothetical protein MVEN_00236800 [Mycena venus]|uniref:Mid2 domain-containing protein n=1 Tax=Mycena venus TaxID=2733690 RepID=A0A8H6Z1S7_9AGAR|nr:hypothetical protein MVEN_00236800 [Mycena venus]